MLNGKKLVIATDSRVWSLGEGRNYRFRELILGFRSLGISVDLVTGRPSIPTAESEAMLSHGIRRIVTNGTNAASRKRPAIRQRLSGLLPGRLRGVWRRMARASPSAGTGSATRITAHRTPELLKILSGYLRSERPDYVMVPYLVNWDCLNALSALPEADRPITLIDTNDVLSDRCAALARHGADPGVDCSRNEEGPLLDLFDIVISIHDEDASIFRSMVRSATVVTCLPAGPVLADPVAAAPPAGPGKILYVAGDSPANRDGLREFLAHCWPEIRRKCPEVSCVIAGKVGTSFQDSRTEGVQFLGFVDDLGDLYRTSSLVISPVNYGGGLKIKALEGLAHGRPVVSTEHSAIGLSAAVGRGLTVAANWPEFTAAVSTLLKCPERLAEEARAAAATAQTFTPDRVIQPLAEAMVAASARRFITGDGDPSGNPRR
jgi:glycosyltransferase involved in cell wall biosynthesis